MEVGKTYLIVMDFGWGFVGTVKELCGFSEVVLDDAHFITKCGDQTDWGRFVRNGPGSNAVVNRIGETVVNLDKRLWSTEYRHDLPKSR